MDSVSNLIRVIGIISRVVGGLTVLFSYIEFSSAKKNNDGRTQDLAVWGMILGSSLVAFGPRMAESLLSDVNQISF